MRKATFVGKIVKRNKKKDKNSEDCHLAESPKESYNESIITDIGHF